MHISSKIGSQLYREYIPYVRSVKRRFIALVDFVEMIDIIRSVAFTVNLRHLGGRNGTNQVSLSGSGGDKPKFSSRRILNWIKRSRFSDGLRPGRSGVRIATGENIFCSPEPSGPALGVKRPGREV